MPTTLDVVPERLRVAYDPWETALYAPVDRFQDKVSELAALGPVVYSSEHGGFWVVTGYPEVQTVLRDAETFSSWPNNIIPHGAGKFLPLELDPPEHGAFRQALQPLFNPTRMKALETEIRGIVTELIDRFSTKGQADFIAEFAHELPTRVFLALMGWPLDDAPLFSECTDITLLGKPGASEEESNAARYEAAGRLTEYFMRAIAERRGGSAESSDVTTAIINTPIVVEGESRLLSDAELANLFHLLSIAGLHTTQGSLAWGVMHLAARPDQRDRLVADTALVPAAVEEVLRIEAAVSMGRRATKDVELGGVQVRAEDQLLMVLSGANRDTREFTQPAEVDIDRSPNRHLSFGAGPHRCIGSHLARVELRIAFEEIHRRLPDYRLVPDDAPVTHGSQTRGVLRLPIAFTPEAAQ